VVIIDFAGWVFGRIMFFSSSLYNGRGYLIRGVRQGFIVPNHVALFALPSLGSFTGAVIVGSCFEILSLLINHMMAKKLLSKPRQLGSSNSIPVPRNGLVSQWIDSKRYSREEVIDFHSCIYSNEELSEQNVVVTTIITVTNLRRLSPRWAVLSNSDLLVRSSMYILIVCVLEELARKRFVYKLFKVSMSKLPLRRLSFLEMGHISFNAWCLQILLYSVVFIYHDLT